MTSSPSQDIINQRQHPPCYGSSIFNDIIVIPPNAINLLVVLYFSTKVICHNRKNANIHRNVKLLFFSFATASTLLSSSFIVGTAICINSPRNADPRATHFFFIFFAPCYVTTSLCILCNLFLRLHLTFGESAYALSATQKRIFFAVVAVELLLGLCCPALSWSLWIDGTWNADEAKASWKAFYFWMSAMAYWVIYFVTCVYAMYKWTHKIFTVAESISSPATPENFPDLEISAQLSAQQACSKLIYKPVRELVLVVMCVCKCTAKVHSFGC